MGVRSPADVLRGLVCRGFRRLRTKYAAPETMRMAKTKWMVLMLLNTWAIHDNTSSTTKSTIIAFSNQR